MDCCYRCGRPKFYNTPCECNNTPNYIIRIENKLDEILKILKKEG